MADVVSSSLNNAPETLMNRLDAYMPLYEHGEDSDEMVTTSYFQ